ncbi:PSD1 and planctomycete cytochrome C domain-containing protein [Rubinisphaera italica]|nr:PSD1 and planctomycete cytochrome C domain-containing protein [Rubinisphaera italica]
MQYLAFVRPVILRLCLLGVFGASTFVCAGELVYETDIRPILKTHCFHCHGEDRDLSGGLDLRLRRMMVSGGDSGPAIVPGDSESSLLIDYVESGMMPPKEEEHLPPEDVTRIRQWIDQGAKIRDLEPEENPEPGEFLISSVERAHWAYQSIQRPDVPQSEYSNPIDAFVSRKLAEHQLEFSEIADKVTLIRRVTFDLTGLVPTPEEVANFVNDPAEDAYEQLLERLLASPHYGERWGRHWLDAAGYADSEGYNDKDILRNDAWHYRDYVINSFNADKPWDEMIVEQIAGDELVQATSANAVALANKDESAREKLIATGYLRMAPDGTGSSPMDANLAQNQTITETIKIVTSSLLATTVACAECHHHRFDPIPQDDFYRLRALFAPVYNTQKWLQPKSRQVAVLSAEDQQKAAEIEAEAKPISDAYNKRLMEVVDLIFERTMESVPEADQEVARTAYQTVKADRTPEQTALLEEKYPMLGLLSRNTVHLFLERYEDGPELKKSYEDLSKKANEIRATKPQPDYLRVAYEVAGQVPETFVFYRGDLNSPIGDPVTPGGLSLFKHGSKPTVQPTEADPAGESLSKLATSGRRLEYAKSLVNGSHPLVSRVLVNRFWHHHFGRGIVDTTGDFGTQGNPPSHPELLDWLASEFMNQGWSLKQFHRLVMTSRTYRQSSKQRPTAMAVDAENRYLWRMPVQRREAESIRDAILFVSGQLNLEMYGPPVPVSTNAGGVLTVGGGKISEDRRELKRTVYIQVRRTEPVAMLQAFDAPSMEPNCERRVVSTVATQSLALLNSDFVLQQAEAFAKRIGKELGENGSPSDQVTAVWNHAYSRTPSPAEMEAATAYLSSQAAHFENQKQKQPDELALASLCQILFSSNEFLYLD